jgi:hypothetical protein
MTASEQSMQHASERSMQSVSESDRRNDSGSSGGRADTAADR